MGSKTIFERLKDIQHGSDESPHEEADAGREYLDYIEGKVRSHRSGINGTPLSKWTPPPQEEELPEQVTH